MAIPNTFTNGTVADATEVNENFTFVNVPIGVILPWAKTFSSADSGTTTSATASKLVQTGQNFLTTVVAGYVVHNTTDDTFAYVTAVDSDTTLSLDSDIMASSEDFVIYKTPELEDNWVECNGQVLSDADSIYNGATIPDLNVTQRFLRGSIFSGTTGGADTHNHGGSTGSTSGTVGDGNFTSTGTPTHTHTISTDSSLPAYYEVVFIMKVK